MERGQKNIMAIGAHIGDAELTCGLTLAKHSKLGDRITTVAVTAGERGAPPGSNISQIEEFRKKNVASAEEFASMMGGKFINIGYPDGEAPDDKELRLKICDIIRAEKPTVILTHWIGSFHVDHVTTAKAVKDATYFAGLQGFERENPPHHSSGLYYAENWEDATDFTPYIYIDVTESFDLWEVAIKKLWLTLNSPWFKYFEYYDALSLTRGALAHVKRAECFAINPYGMKVVQQSF